MVKDVFALLNDRCKLRRLVFLAMLVALGVVLSPILRVPGMAPMQHFINVICAVLLGPWYAFTCAVLIAILRMSLLGVNMLALSGSIFGAILAGYFYQYSHRLLGAVLGEFIGTGIIGALVSYPVMAFIYGSSEVALFTYMPSFIMGSLIGSLIALVFLQILNKQGVLIQMKRRLWEA